MSFTTMNNNNVFTTNNDIFALPNISFSDNEELNGQEFELFPEVKPEPLAAPLKEETFFLNSVGSQSVLKSKAGASEVTRADSIESLTVFSGPAKSIKKTRGKKRTAKRKSKTSKKVAKKVRKTKMLSHYHQEENTEFTS
jgi:hypothetical protein